MEGEVRPLGRWVSNEGLLASTEGLLALSTDGLLGLSIDGLLAVVGVTGDAGMSGRCDVDAEGIGRPKVGDRGECGAPNGLVARGVVGEPGGLFKGKCEALAAARLEAKYPLRGEGDAGGDRSGDLAKSLFLLLGVSGGPGESVTRLGEGRGSGARGTVICSDLAARCVLCSGEGTGLDDPFARGSRLDRGRGPLISFAVGGTPDDRFIRSRGGETSAATLDDDAGIENG